MTDEQKEIHERLKKLREPFAEEHIDKKVQPTCKASEWRNLPKSHCNICGGYHPSEKTIHLDYVGHAALTNRLLDVDPEWTWAPMAYTEQGTPAFDRQGGIWIWLTICGITRPGYGDCGGKFDANGVKEAIGDALRNAAMRFGCALDLWFRGDKPLFTDDEHPQGPPKQIQPSTQVQTSAQKQQPAQRQAQPKTSQQFQNQNSRPDGITVMKTKICELLSRDGCNPQEQMDCLAWIEQEGLQINYFLNNYQRCFDRWAASRNGELPPNVKNNPDAMFDDQGDPRGPFDGLTDDDIPF